MGDFNMADMEQYVLNKVDTIEKKLETQVEKISNKLDQIVDIMRTVAQLQEREARNSEDIMELRKSLRDSMDNYTKTIVRIHERLDKQDDDQKLTEKEINNNINTVSRDVDQRIDRIMEHEEVTHQTILTDVRIVENRLNMWLNRGIGAWAAASVLLLVIQGIGGYLLSSMKDDFTAVRAQGQLIEKRVIELEQSYKHDPRLILPETKPQK